LTPQLANKSCKILAADKSSKSKPDVDVMPNLGHAGRPKIRRLYNIGIIDDPAGGIDGFSLIKDIITTKKG